MENLPPNYKPLQFPKPWDRLFSLGSRLLVWGAFFWVLHILRSFFLLIFFTFVFTYIQSTGVNFLGKKINNRSVRVILVALFYLSILIAVGIFLVPKVKKQTEIFLSQYTIYIQRLDQELFRISERYPLLKEIMPELKDENHNGYKDDKKMDLKNSPTANFLQQLTGLNEEPDGLKKMNQIIETIGKISGKIVSITSAFLLSLLFSFLIVLDLPKLKKSVQGLENTKLRFIYIEVAENIKEFAQALGRALEAQFLIAIVNSILTAIGISLLGLGKNLAFLAVIVFLSSFIPVVGVFLSSIPICLIALQTSGLHTMFLAILLIIVIHLIEGYILNPRIYGSYMRINPVIVLFILTIGGKLFHVWGLILGVPISAYIYSYAIQYRKETKNVKEAT